MNHRSYMGVAEVIDIGAGGVEKGRAQRIDALGAPDHGYLFTARKFAERTKRSFDRLGTATGQCNRKEIHERAFGLMPHRRWDVFPPRCTNVSSQALGHAGFVQHRSSP